MTTQRIITIIIAVAVVVVIVLIFWRLSKRSEKKQAEQEAQIEQYKQQITMLVIDKKKMRPKDAGLPKQALDSMPWYSGLFKLCVVKAKVGPKIMIFIANSEIFDSIPVKKEIKAMVSGLYIVSVRGIRGPLEQKEQKTGPLRKLMGFTQR